MKKTRLLILVAFAGLALSACNGASLPVSTHYTEEELSDLGGSITTPWSDYTVPATEVSFPEEDMLVNLNKGDTYTYHPTISPKSATIQALTFTSEDENVATAVNGVLTARGGGSTTIVVSSKENAFNPIELLVNVTVPVTDFNVNKDALDLGYGYTEQLSVTYVPADTTQEGVTFTSDNAEIASVNEDGLVTAGNADGTTKIKVTSPYMNTVKEVTVTVEDKVIHVSSVSITNKQATLQLDKSFALNAKVEPENAENKGIDYVSSNENVAVIDAAGNVNAIGVGETKITAKSQEIPTIVDEYNLTVYAITADTLEVPAELNLIVNGIEQLRPVYKKAGETVTPSRSIITYESDHPEIASVSAAGLISAKSEGTAHITVKDTAANAPLELESVITVNVAKDIAEFTVTNFADWTPNDGAVVFAWVWGGDAGYPGAWTPIALSYQGDPNDYTNVTGTFFAPRNIEGAVFVRCMNGTVTPDWEATGDEEGRIYNKTNDMVIFGTEIVAQSWIEYPPEPELEGFGIKFGNGVSIVGEEAGYDYYGRAQYSLENVHFTEGSTFSIYNFSDKAGWVETIEGYSFGGDSESSENWKSYLEIGENEYTVLVDFVADIFLKIAYENNSVYFGLVEEPVIADNYAVKIGDVTTNLVEGVPNGTELKMFHASNVKVGADETVTFFGNNVAITSHIGPDADDLTVGSEKYNNFRGSVSSLLTIQADNDKADIYLRIYEDGMSFWISGGTSADHDLDLPDEGFGLLFESGAAIIGVDKGEETIGDITYHQYLISGEQFLTGEQFKLYDFSNKAGWLDDIDQYSFDGDPEHPEIWKEYLAKGSEFYAVKQDFYADVWLKLSMSGNNIYFGLVNEPVPVAAEYKVKLGDTAYVLEEQALTEQDLENNMVAKYAINHDVVGGEALAFIADGKTIRSNIAGNSDDYTPGEEKYNNYIIADLDFVTQADAANALIELNIYRDSYSFWVAGGINDDHEKPGNYYLTGSFNSWLTPDDTYKLTKVERDHYKVENVAFTAEDTLKVYWPDGETEPDKYISNETTYDDCGYTLDVDGNIVISETATYTVELWFNSTSILTGNHVTLTKQVEFADVYSMKINDVDMGLTKSLEDLDPNEEMKFTVASVAVVAGQTIEMFADDVAITENLGPDSDDLTLGEEKYNNYNGSLAGGFVVQNSGTVDITMHIWKSGYVSFWISGGDNADHTVPVDYFLIGGFNSWTSSDVNYKLTKVNANQYQITGVEFVAGDTLKVYWPDGEQEVDKYFSDATTWEGCGFTLDGDGNVVISADGTYTVDFYVTADYNNHIVLTRTGDLTTLHLSAYSANVIVGGDTAVVTANHVTGTLVAESDDTDIATVAVDGSNITITAVATGTATITVGDDGVVERTITVNVSGTKNIGVSFGAWKGDSAAIYAWVWGEGVTAQWVEFDSANNRFVVPEGITGLKLVRMNPADVTLTNKYSFDGLTGSKWNESGDLTYEAGKVLTFAEWNVEGYSTFTWDEPAP